MFARVEVAVRPEFPDPKADSLLRRIELAYPDLRRGIRWARMLDVYWIELDASRDVVKPAITEIFADRVLNWLLTGDLIPSAAGEHGSVQDLLDQAPFRWGKFVGLEKHFRPGVTDNVARTAQEAFKIVLKDEVKSVRVASGSLLILDHPEISESDLGVLARDVFCNELIESWNMVTGEELKKADRFHYEQVKWDLPRAPVASAARRKTQPLIEKIVLDGLDENQLVDLSTRKLWALNADEMKAIQTHYQELKRDPTDVEMEVFAQTWSEHCKHKIFNAEIDYASSHDELPPKISSLFKETIAGTTEQLQRPWLASVFKDNAGLVHLDEEDSICIKVETHNSPSALDPYGGALTGIVGVNRDILGCGRGARPLFNTNVFCVARPDYTQTLPDRILHPRRILEGVRHGVEDGGNKSGIPTINGALVFDQRFLGKPLIYCGTGGIIPRRIEGVPSELKEIRRGDQICMVGGRIGKDGIHGATFSSLALDESSPQSAVQLGDPITQKRVADFLFEARELGLYRTITDNGAGGLSSSVGEMALLSGGARMDVKKAKTKYEGLRPYELVVSESQERMTVAVPEQYLAEFLSLATRRNVEVSVLGEFNSSGKLEISYGQEKVADLDLGFLHDGVPKMKLRGVWTGMPKIRPGVIERSFEAEAETVLLDLLGRPAIASKEWLIRQYDHEVQGTSVVKPLHSDLSEIESRSGPNDAGVIKPKADSWVGIAVGCGINPKLSDLDPYLMAQSSVDEAIRNILAVGANFGKEEDVIALTDNFCWPDPVGNEEKTGALVRACFGLKDAALALQAPLVSGKDSMKNDYRGQRDGKNIQISVPPTLLVTAMAKLSDIRLAMTSDFKAAGETIYLVGHRHFGLLGSELHTMLVESLVDKGGQSGQVVLPVTRSEGEPRVGLPDWEVAWKTYSWLGRSKGKKHELLTSIHDVSEGGMLVAIAESLLSPNLGARIDIPYIDPPLSHAAQSGEAMELDPETQEDRKIDPWELCFGEGFHSFVVGVSGGDAEIVEAEWSENQVPFLKLGVTTPDPFLEVKFGSEAPWKVSTSDLRKAWTKEGFWQ